MNMWLRVLVLVPLVAGFSLSGVASKLRGDGHITDALGNDIDTHGQWWTPNDRDVFKGNMGINKYQPPSVKSFTDAGFKKLKIPGDLWTGIKTFFDKNRNNAINEGTVPGYIVGKTTWMTYIDGDLRDRVFSTMKPILSDWAGVPLAESAVYGIRKVRSVRIGPLVLVSPCSHIFVGLGFHAPVHQWQLPPGARRQQRHSYH
jgi:hypothetical protein